jgi:hypothetical protein
MPWQRVQLEARNIDTAAVYAIGGGKDHGQ